MKKLSFLLTSTFSFLLLTSSSLALGDIDTNPTNTTNDCLKLTQNLRLRSNDTTTSNEVTKLQLFLKNNGFLNINPTGYFGSVTKAAVIAYQLSVQLDGTGYVGSYTRGEIAKDTCDNINDNPNTTSVPIGVGSVNNNPVNTVATGVVNANIPNIYGNISFLGTTTITMMSASIYNGGEGLKFCLYQPSESPCTNLQPLLQAGGLNFTYSQANGGTYTLQQDVSSKGYPAIPYKLRLVKTNGEEKTLTLNKIGGVITNTILFSSNTTGDGTKVTNMNITIKNGGEGLKYCIETYQSTTYCTNTALLTSSGLNWKYTPEDGGTYTVNQDVSGSNFPFTNYRVYLEKASGESSRVTLEVKKPEAAAATVTASTNSGTSISSSPSSSSPLFYNASISNGMKVLNFNILIKNGGENLKYCMFNSSGATNFSPNTCNDSIFTPVLYSGYVFKYSPEDGGTYTINQNVSSKDIPATIFGLILEKSSGERFYTSFAANPTSTIITIDPSVIKSNLLSYKPLQKLSGETTIQEAEQFPNSPEFNKARKAGVFDPRNISLKTLHPSYPFLGNSKDCAKAGSINGYGVKCEGLLNIPVNGTYIRGSVGISSSANSANMCMNPKDSTGYVTWSTESDRGTNVDFDKGLGVLKELNLINGSPTVFKIVIPPGAQMAAMRDLRFYTTEFGYLVRSTKENDLSTPYMQFAGYGGLLPSFTTKGYTADDPVSSPLIPYALEMKKSTTNPTEKAVYYWIDSNFPPDRQDLIGKYSYDIVTSYFTLFINDIPLYNAWVERTTGVTCPK